MLRTTYSWLDFRHLWPHRLTSCHLPGLSHLAAPALLLPSGIACDLLDAFWHLLHSTGDLCHLGWPVNLLQLRSPVWCWYPVSWRLSYFHLILKVHERRGYFNAELCTFPITDLRFWVMVHRAPNNCPISIFEQAFHLDCQVTAADFIGVAEAFCQLVLSDILKTIFQESSPILKIFRLL